MRIDLDVTALCSPRVSGVGVYVRCLWAALDARGDVALRGTWHPTALRWARWRLLPPGIGRRSRGRWPLLARASARRRGALVHGTDFRVPPWPGVPRVATVHDLAAFHPGYLPDDHAARTRRRLEALTGDDGPDAVITMSRAVADDIESRLPALAGHIHVVPHGGDHLPAARPAGRPPYYLAVGNVERRKNVDQLVTAFAAVASSDREVRLVLVGRLGHRGDHVEQAIAASPARDRIERREAVPDDELAALYAGARALVYPSRYEGFGLPVAEALHAGCPVITGRRGAPAEVAGGAALLFDTSRPDDLAAAMLAVRDEARREELRELGRARARELTWARCAEQTVAVYAEVLRRRGGGSG